VLSWPDLPGLSWPSAVPACSPFGADGQRHGFCSLQAWPTASAAGVDRARHHHRGASDPGPPPPRLASPAGDPL